MRREGTGSMWAPVVAGWERLVGAPVEPEPGAGPEAPYAAGGGSANALITSAPLPQEGAGQCP